MSVRLRVKRVLDNTGDNTGARVKIVVKGDTFPVRDKLKTLGLKWDSLCKCWYIYSNEMDFNELMEKLRSIAEAEVVHESKHVLYRVTCPACLKPGEHIDREKLLKALYQHLLEDHYSDEKEVEEIMKKVRVEAYDI